MLFERTALSRKPDKTIENDLKFLREEDRLTPDLVFRDPYILDFLGLKDTYAEKGETHSYALCTLCLSSDAPVVMWPGARLLAEETICGRRKDFSEFQKTAVGQEA
jgi:hypothetical protein